jgi:hypothetical protein
LEQREIFLQLIGKKIMYYIEMIKEITRLANAILDKDTFFMTCIKGLANQETYADAFGDLVLYATANNVGIEIFDRNGDPIFDSHDQIATKEKKMKGKLLQIEMVKSIVNGDFFMNVDNTDHLTRSLPDGNFVRGNNAPLSTYVYVGVGDDDLSTVPKEGVLVSTPKNLQELSNITEIAKGESGGVDIDLESDLQQEFPNITEISKGESGGVDLVFDICGTDSATVQIGKYCQPSVIYRPDILRPCNNDFYRVLKTLSSDDPTESTLIFRILDGNFVITACDVIVPADDLARLNISFLIIGICVLKLDDGLKRAISRFLYRKLNMSSIP